MLDRRSFLALGAAVLCAASVALAAENPASPLSAAQIAERNAAARGGLDAWRAVQTMSMSGKIDATKPRPDPMQTIAATRPTKKGEPHQKMPLAKGEPIQLPFTMELKRSRKMRLEVAFQGQSAVQVYDGSHGWKLRPYLGRHEVEPFSAEETTLAADQQELDGPLIDYAAKGSTVELEGVEQVEGRDAYKLKVTLKNGHVRRVWVDAKTFLDVRVDGQRRMNGRLMPMYTMMRDYKKVDGLMIPYVMETTVDGVTGSEKIMVDRVALNPHLDDSAFAKPQ